MTLCAWKSYPEDSLQTLSGYWNTPAAWGLPFCLGSQAKALNLPLCVHMCACTVGQSLDLLPRVKPPTWHLKERNRMRKPGYILSCGDAHSSVCSSPSGHSSWLVTLPLGLSCCRGHSFGGRICAHHTARHQGPQCWLLMADLIGLWVLLSVSASLHLAPCKAFS